MMHECERSRRGGQRSIHWRGLALVAAAVITWQHADVRAADVGALAAGLDESRVPAVSFVATVEIRHVKKSGEPPALAVFKSHTRTGADGAVSTLLLCSEPAKDAGKRMLVLPDGCWFYDPRAKRPTRISAGQIWSQPTATDSPNWRLARDFDAVITGEESVPCADGRARMCTVVDFTPRDPRSVAPARLRYWVDAQGRYWRARHFTRSGKEFKTIEIIRHARVLGAERAVSLRITSGPEAAEVVLTDFQEEGAQSLWFEPQNFYRVQP